MSNYTLLDTRGLLLRDYHGSSYKTVQTAEGSIPSWQDGLAAFIDRTLWPMLSRTPPRQIIACFDDGNTYRRSVFPGYKQHRRDKEPAPEQAEQLNELMKQARRLLAYLGIKTVHAPGEEADDLIALFCQKLWANAITVHTRDADLLQLVDQRTGVIFLDQLYALNGYGQTELKGVPLRHIRLMKSIVGDSSDGYPGIPGCGPKFFEELSEAFGGDGLAQLEAIVAAGQRQSLQGTGDKRMDKLDAGWDDWRRCYNLAGLHPEVCYGAYKGAPRVPVWYARVPNQKVVRGILAEIGVESRLSEIEYFFPAERLITAAQADALPGLMQQIMASEIVSYDFESSDKLDHAPFREAVPNYVDVLSQELAGISINYGNNLQYTIYVPFDHAETDNLSKDWARWLLQSLDQRPDRPVVQNANFELSVAMTDLGIRLRAPYDTAVMASYVDENQESGLKDNSLAWFNYKQTTYKEVTQGRKMCEMPAHEVLSYGCDDSLLTSHLFDIKRIVMQLEGSWQFYCTNEVDPAGDDVEVFVAGTEVNLQEMARLREESAERVREATVRIHAALADYCSSGDSETVNECAVKLLQEWWSIDKFKYQGDQAKFDAAYQALWTKAWNGCFYQPPADAAPVAAVQWSPTPARINKLIERFGGELAPQLTSIAMARVEEWDLRMSDYLQQEEQDLAKAEKAGSLGVGWAEHVDGVQSLRELHQLVWEARNNLSPAKRNGPAYDALVSFAEQFSAPKKAAPVRGEINFSSSPQMQTLLYGKLQLPIRRRSKVTRGTLRDKQKLKGPPATGLKAVAAALVYDVLEQDDWRMQVLLDYKDICLLQQEASLYYKSYPLLIHPRDGKLHPQFKNCGTATRRPTGTAPNMLQVSKKGESKIRRCLPGGDYGDGQRVYVSADFATQELLITAVESQDPVMLSAFLSNPRRDLHSLTACGFAHILLPRLGVNCNGPLSYEEFTSGRHHEEPKVRKAFKEIRDKYAKPVAFLIVYGGGYTTLAENLLIGEDLAKSLMEGTFNVYSRLKPWQEEVSEYARLHGYSQTAYGNRRHATKDLYSADNGLAKRQERQLSNAVIQSTAADILKVVRQEMFNRKFQERYRLKAVKQVYDEITASVPIDLATDYALELTEIMQVTPPGYPVKMPVELSIGATWGGVEEVAMERSAIEELIAKLRGAAV